MVLRGLNVWIPSQGALRFSESVQAYPFGIPGYHKECRYNNPNEKLQERLIFILKGWYNCGDFPNSQLAKQNNSLPTSPPSKSAMFVTLTTTDGGRLTGPSSIVLTRNSTSPVVTTQLGSFASSALASERRKCFSAFGDGLLCCRGSLKNKPRRWRQRERH